VVPEPAPAPSPQPVTVEISVESHPPGRVLVDGKPVGVSPVSLHLHGDHARIEIRRPGYFTVSQDLALDRDQRLVVTLTRDKRPAGPAKPKSDGDDFHRFDESP
jgi:hypothetical protein